MEGNQPNRGYMCTVAELKEQGLPKIFEAQMIPSVTQDAKQAISELDVYPSVFWSSFDQMNHLYLNENAYSVPLYT